jgi:hypothetical protein
MKPLSQKLTAGALLLILFAVEYLPFLSLDSFGPYALYVFELIWVAAVWLVFRGMPLLPEVPKESAMVRAAGWSGRRDGETWGGSRPWCFYPWDGLFIGTHKVRSF